MTHETVIRNKALCNDQIIAWVSASRRTRPCQPRAFRAVSRSKLPARPELRVREQPYGSLLRRHSWGHALCALHHPAQGHRGGAQLPQNRAGRQQHSKPPLWVSSRVLSLSSSSPRRCWKQRLRLGSRPGDLGSASGSLTFVTELHVLGDAKDRAGFPELGSSTTKV